MTYKRNVLGLGERIADPINSLDYPWSLDDKAVVLWVSHGRWPDADRWIRYISKTQLDAMKGFHLITVQPRDAMKFDTVQAGLEFLAAENKKRGPGNHWRGIQVTTVEKLKHHFGFYVEV